MKFYETPKLNMLTLSSEDIITTRDLTNGGGNGDPLSMFWDDGVDINLNS